MERMERSDGTVEAVERKLLALRRRVKWYGVLTTVTLVLLLGVILVSATRDAPRPIGPQDRLVVRGLQIQDASGEGRITLTLHDRYGAALVFGDESGRRRMMMNVTDPGIPMITLFGPDGERRVATAVNPDGAFLTLFDPEGTAGLSLDERSWHVQNNEGRTEAGYILEDGVSAFFLADQNGQRRSTWTYNGLVAAFGVYDNNGDLIWHAPREPFLQAD